MIIEALLGRLSFETLTADTDTADTALPAASAILTEETGFLKS